MIIEVVLRVVDPIDYTRIQTDEVSGLLTYKPTYTFTHATPCVTNIVQTNDMGFYGDAVDTFDERARIVILGSSFVEALHVPMESTVASQLEQLLTTADASYSVVPIAFSGNGSYLNALYYKYFASPLTPELVIVILTGYEFIELLSQKHQPSFDATDTLVFNLPTSTLRGPVSNLKDILRHSKLVMHIQKQRIQFMDALARVYERRIGHLVSAPRGVADISTEVSLDEIWSIEEKLLHSLTKQVRADGGDILFATWFNHSIATTTQVFLDTRMSEFSRTRNVAYVKLNGYVERHAKSTGKSVVFSCDGHWNVYGHRYIAEGLFEYMNEMNFFNHK